MLNNEKITLMTKLSLYELEELCQEAKKIKKDAI